MNHGRSTGTKLKAFLLYGMVPGLILAGCSDGSDVDPGSAADASVEGADGDAATDAGDPAGGSLTVAVNEPVTGFDPAKLPGGMSNNFHFNVFDGLYNISPDGEVALALATSHESSDGVEHIFELRDDVVFHDGTPFTADDVRFTLERVLDPEFESATGSNLQNITEIEVVDDHTVILRLDSPDEALPNALVTQSALIVPEAYLTEVGDDGFFDEPIGTGPFRFAENREGEFVRVEANADYWGEVPRLDEVTIRGVSEAGARVAMLQAGEVDMVVGIDPTQMDSLRAGGFEVDSAPSGETVYLYMRQDMDQLEDARVRQALNLAVDREAIVEFIYMGAATPVNSIFAASQPLYDPSLDIFPHDPERASELLDEAGYDRSEELSILVPQDRWVKAGEAAEAIAADLRALDINVNLDLQDIGLVRDQVSDGTVGPLYMFNSRSVTLDQMLGLAAWHTCDGNVAYTCDPEFDQLVEEMSRTPFDDRPAKAAEIAAYTHENPIGLYLWENHDVVATTDAVSWTPAGGSGLFLMDRWSIDAG